MSSRVLDFEKYTAKARQAVAEGQVLLLNQNHVLPLPKGSHVAVFGRMQLHYYKSGTGSGGMVNVNKVTGILEALEESEDVQVYEPLVGVYREWEKDHPFDEGVGWGNEPWSQEEMELNEALVEEAAEKNEYAIVILARTAGEDKDNKMLEGAYCLTSIEEDMLQKVRKSFAKMIVLLNTGNIMDMSFMDQYRPDAVMYVWQGGMIGRPWNGRCPYRQGVSVRPTFGYDCGTDVRLSGRSLFWRPGTKPLRGGYLCRIPVF